MSKTETPTELIGRLAEVVRSMGSSIVSHESVLNEMSTMLLRHEDTIARLTTELEEFKSEV